MSKTIELTFATEQEEYTAGSGSERSRRIRLGTKRFFAKESFINFDLTKMDVSRYRRNPVVFYNHAKYGGEDLPLGRTTDLRYNSRGDLNAEFDFSENLTPALQTVQEQYNEGIIKAASLGVGFNFDDVRPQENGKLYAEKVYMNEWSLVTIPADKNALTFSADFNMQNMLALWLPEETAVKVEDEFPNLLEAVDIREDEVEFAGSLDDFDGDEFEALLQEIVNA